ncbi:MAG: right-handed parallel beta-helix repeat-containing protein [Candidatus Omnitrophota bacterium]
MMKRKFLLTFLIILSAAMSGFTQNVLVNGVDGEDYDSSPRDEDGKIIGPETDNTFESFYRAVNFLMEFRNGGTVSIGTFGPAQGIAIANKPLTVIGIGENQSIDGEIQISGASLTVKNLKFVAGQFQKSAIFLDNASLNAENVVFDQRGIQASGEGEADITVKDCVFINAQSNGLAAFTARLNVDFQNVEFKDFTAGNNKCLAIMPSSGFANVNVKDCTFTNCYLGVDDRHVDGEAFYQNLSMKNMSRIGINIEWDGMIRQFGNVRTVITDCVFDNCAYQAVHLHAQQNVTVSNVSVVNSGSVSFRENDGAGIGGHDGNVNILIEDCESNNNQGNGFNFEWDREITLRNNIAYDNGLCGAGFLHCETVALENGNCFSGNALQGIRMAQTNDWKIYNNTIGLNRERNQEKGNLLAGALLSSVGSGEFGSTEDPLKGNIVSGNKGDGVYLQSSQWLETANIKIGSNYIGTDGNAENAFPNARGIVIDGNGSPTGIPFIQIGGRNPSMENPQNPDRGVGNVISGNRENGIVVEALSTDLFDQGRIDIWGNFIGANGSGTSLLSNGQNGVQIHPNRFFEINLGSIDDKAKGNLISGNNENGILLGGNRIGEMKISKVKILNNLIGAAIDRTARLPNQKNGIEMTDGASDQELGYGVTDNLVAKNIIHHNSENGIRIVGAKALRNQISENSIHRNDKKGILLEKGANNEISVALNHALDSVKAVNKISGQSSAPNAKIEIFADPAFADANPGYWGQGKKYIRTIDADDKGKFEIDVDSIADPGMITATATDADKNTSEFSPFASIVVVQVAGDENNMLVANKPAAVRIFSNAGKDAASYDITGEVIFQEATILPEPPMFAMKPFGGYRTNFNDRREGKSSLNFYILNPPQGSHKIEVALKHRNEERGRFLFGPFDFQKTKNLSLGVVYVLAPLRAGGLAVAFPDLGLVRQSAEFFADIYPIEPQEFMRRYRILYPIVMGIPPHTAEIRKGMIQTANAYRLLSRPPLDYAVVAVAYETYFEPPGSTWLIYGMTRGDYPNVVAMLDGLKNRRPVLHSGDTLAHEIGHTTPFNLGDTYNGGTYRVINPRDPANSDTDGNFILEENFAFSPTGVFDNQIPPKRQAVFSDIGNRNYVYDIMGGAPPAWFDEKTYKVLFKGLGGVVKGEPAKAVRPRQETLPSSILVRGEIGDDNQVRFSPLIFKEEPVVRPSAAAAREGFHIDLLDADGAILDAQDFPTALGGGEILGIDTNTGRSINGYYQDTHFHFTTILKNDPSAVRIVVGNGDQILGELIKSAHIPSVIDISGLDSGALPSEQFVLSWKGSDLDPLDTLYYNILYTPDNGETIIPIAADLETIDSLPIYPQFLPSGPDPQFRICVSDGWNQSCANNQKLVMNNRAPMVSIVQPRANDKISQQLPVTLLGSAYDLEDGFIADEALEWRLDDEQTPLGAGSKLSVDLELGQHTIKLIAADSAGLQGYAEVIVEVTVQGDTGVKHWKIFD